MGSRTTTDGTTALHTHSPRYGHERRQRRITATSNRGGNSVEPRPRSRSGSDVVGVDDDSTRSHIIEVRDGQRAMGRARGRLVQTSLIFQALLALALILSVLAMVQHRVATDSGSPDADPPSVLIQVRE